MRICIALLAAFWLSVSFSQDKALLNPNTIPEALKKDADAVYRVENIECHILSESRAKVTYSYVITVLNPRGLDEAKIRLPYSSFYKVSKPRGAIYTSTGKKYRSIQADEVADVSNISNSSLYDDSRILLYDPPTKTTPFTIVYSYDVTLDGNLFLPSWSAFKGYNVSVEKTVFKVIVNSGLDFKYLEQGLSKPVTKTQDKAETIYLWSVENQAAAKSEPASTNVTLRYPTVFIALNNFDFYDTNGSLKDWKAFGQWIAELNRGRQELPESTVQKMKDLTNDLKSDAEKVEAIYTYMQNKCHYVNLAIDIGGWQPIEAARVDEVGYGDCKALSNYTKSLLNAVGIHSFYCVIHAGDRIPDFNTTFVSSRFNHAILCVPLENDTIWLECTSQKIPAGFLSTFTDNRYALLIDSGQSKLVKTKQLNGYLNGIKRHVLVTFDPTFDAEFDVKAQYSGEFEDEVGWWRLDNQEDKRRETYDNLNFPDIILKSYNYEVRKDLNAVEQTLKFTVPALATKMGSRYILELNHLNRRTYIPKKVFNRTSDIEIQRSSIETDTVIFILPEGYKLETAIKPITCSSEFGTYTATVSYEGNRLTYIRNMAFNKGLYDKALYGKYIDFFQDVKYADEQKVLLTKM